MPKLKRLDVQGFKSFAEPLTFVLPTGITAIVGPNGSGKSNIADAVRWVLGEQRLSTIRGKSGEDMIFVGSGRRARAGMARVAITFDNVEGWLPVDFAEVTVERRTYRDGKTDYLLNGSRVRLMDIRDVLDRAGLGRDAYLIIGQGLVDQVLALRPQERLALFEQAAGIAPYRSRREEALGRLEGTQRNLQRVYDIVGEIEPRLRRLQRQAGRAEQHALLTQELNDILRIWYGHRWGRSVASLEQARQRASYREDRVLRLLEEADEATARVTQQRQEIGGIRSRLAEVLRESGVCQNEAGRYQRDLAVARERHRQIQRQLDETQNNIVPLQATRDAARGELAELLAEYEALQSQVAEERAALEQVEADYAHLESQRHQVIAQQSRCQSEALEQRHRLADRQSRIAQATQRLERLTQRVADLERQMTETVAARRAQQALVEQTRQSLDQAEVALASQQEEVAQLEAALSEAEIMVGRLRQALAERSAEHQRLATRLEVLERVHAEGEGLYAGVRAVVQAIESDQLNGLAGTISSLVRIPGELDRAIETALGGQLQDIVSETWRDAEAAIQWLKRNRAGRATFLPLDTLRPPTPLELPSSSDGSDVVGLASELVDCDPRHRPAVDLLLGRTAVTRTLEAARRLYRQLRGSFRIVTLEGEIVRSGGAVTGGEERRTQGSGLLARERERRELPEKVATLEREVRDLENRLSEANGRVQMLQQALRAATERRRASERELQEAERILERHVRALESVIQQDDWQRRQLEEAENERAQLKEAYATFEKDVAEAQTALAERETELERLSMVLSGLDNTEATRLLGERRTAVALLEQRLGNRRVLWETRSRETQRVEAQIAALEEHAQELTSEMAVLTEQLAVLQTTYTEARARAEALAAQISPLENQVAEAESALEMLERREREARRALRDAEQWLAQAELEANRREDQLQNLRREIEETLGIVVGNLPESILVQQPLPLDAIVSPLPTVLELPEGLEHQIRDLRTQIRRLEPVNPAAKEEYDELQTRHSFLREQMHDLEVASSHLHEVISELDEMMETMFSTTFRAIATEFSRIFELLFNGGVARLELVGDDMTSAGVDITARPPGKRTSGLDMLSGGERTLTAIALLFAVMRVSPTPFCILDEVDAMLDEANVSRFRKMLLELSRQTQFILITHNRGTVEAADTLYGVSMGDDGVSQVLSLSLEDLPASEPL